MHKLKKRIKEKVAKKILLEAAVAKNVADLANELNCSFSKVCAEIITARFSETDEYLHRVRFEERVT